MGRWILFIGMIMVISVFTVSCTSKEVSITQTYYETEYKTESKIETYTEIENVVTKTVDGKQEIYNSGGWFSDTVYFSNGEGKRTYYYHYVIDTSTHTRSQIKITIYSATDGYIGVYNLTDIGEISAPPTPSTWEYKVLVSIRNSWLGNLNSMLTNSRLLGSYEKSSNFTNDASTSNEIIFDANGIKEFGIFANTDPENVINRVELSWSDDIISKKEVTKEKQVPYQVPIQVEKQRTVTQTKQVPFWEVIFH